MDFSSFFFGTLSPALAPMKLIGISIPGCISDNFINSLAISKF